MLKRSPIRRVSKRRAVENKIHSQLRREFLEKHPFCEVMQQVFKKTYMATDIHHMRGRFGNRLNDQEHWLAVSRTGHDWIRDNPKEAERRGFLDPKRFA